MRISQNIWTNKKMITRENNNILFTYFKKISQIFPFHLSPMILPSRWTNNRIQLRARILVHPFISIFPQIYFSTSQFTTTIVNIPCNYSKMQIWKRLVTRSRMLENFYKIGHISSKLVCPRASGHDIGRSRFSLFSGHKNSLRRNLFARRFEGWTHGKSRLRQGE